MKIPSIAIILFLLISCSDRKGTKNSNEIGEANPNIQKTEFQSIIDSSGLEGAILIYDSQTGLYYSNNFEWCEEGRLPASTFKITNSIIALETGVVENDSTLFKWNGESRVLKNWEQDLTFREAFHYSCVPCYQEVAQKIGPQRMKEYLEQFNYGEMIVDSTSIATFWLEGESKISQFQQIEFLRKFYQSELPITESTERIMKGLMVIEENKDYKLSGKTGWAIRNGNNNGWFVGYIETEDNLYYFAINVDPKEQFNMEMFPMIRKEVTYKALKEMKII